MRHFFVALGRWLGLLELLAGVAGLRGLSWGGRLGWIGAMALARGKEPGAGLMLAALPVALLLQIGLASLRWWRLNPLEQLRAGAYAGRTISRIDIAGKHGPVPALLIEPEGEATAALLVAHGSGCDKTFYAWRLADAAVERGAALLLIDLDGHGESPRPQSFPQIIESVAGPARWLRERYGRVGILGMSLGGAVAARAVAEGAPCDALAIWAAPAQLRLDAAAYRQVQIHEATRLARPQLLHLFRDGSLPHIVGAWRTSGIRASIGTWDLFDALDLLGSLQRIGVRPDRPPLLLYYAGRDAIVGLEQAEAVREATAGWGEYRLVRGASHISLPIEEAVIGGTVGWIVRMCA